MDPDAASASLTERRLLLLAPAAGDSGLRSTAQSAGVEALVCHDVDQLLTELRHGAAALLLTEEPARAHVRVLESALSHQPAWSDLPILLVAKQSGESDALAETIRALGNVTVSERSASHVALASTIASAVRARAKQYALRDLMASRDGAGGTADEHHRYDEFLATLGHELRNPLASILTGLELVRLAGITEPLALRAISVINRQVNHLARLVDDLLEVSRISRGMIEIRKDRLDLGDVLRAAVDESRGIIDASQHELTVDIPAAPMPVTGDRARLTQIFANLLNNAAKYTQAAGHLALAARLEDQRVVVSVKDNGIGLDPSLLTQVFEMFTQVDRVNRRTQGGLGIGLTLVRSLVAVHGGSVEARSEGTGSGAEFIVTLPLLNERPDAMSRSAIGHRQFPARRVLVVDDNQDAAENLSTLLKTLGSDVSVAHSGREALERVDAVAPDVVLLDIGMPGLDGYEVARRLRARPQSAHLLLIALTGWGRDEDRRRSHDAGFDHHMVKPPNLEQLRDYLERRQDVTAADAQALARRKADHVSPPSAG